MSYLDDIQMVKNVLAETAKYANGLAVGLQNAAPPQEGLPPSVRYLSETTEQLQEKLARVNQLIDKLA